ncbi:unnamed protein product, partial [Didymodactylos carnosus]
MFRVVLGTAISGGIIYFCGLIGNLLSFIIFTQKDVRRVSTGQLFLFLTIFNTIHMYTLLVEYFDNIYNLKAYKNNIFFRCRFQPYIQNLSRILSSYIAFTICIDR